MKRVLLTLLILAATTGWAAACSPVPPTPLEEYLKGGTALAYGRIVSETLSGKATLAVQSYVGPGQAPENLTLHMTRHSINPDCSERDRLSLLGSEMVVVLTGDPPDRTPSALKYAQTIHVNSYRSLNTKGNEMLDEVLAQFAATHGYAVATLPYRAPDSFTLIPLIKPAKQLAWAAGAAALVFATILLIRRRRQRQA